MSRFRSEYRRSVETGQRAEKLAIDPRGPGNRAPAWAENRAHLIESLPYFRQAQQGVYQSGMIIRGALIDGYGGQHTHFDDDIIITKLDGGGDSSIGAYKRHASARLSAARATQEQGSSIGIILGSEAGNAATIKIEPAKPCRYAVLGEYIITDIWFEKQGAKQNTVTMVRYQRRGFQEPPWWRASSSSSSSPPWEKKSGIRSSFSSKTCSGCGERSPKRYAVWFCANHQCAEFSSPGGQALPDGLGFSKRYLLQRTTPTTDQPLDLFPNRLGKPTLLKDMRKGSVCQRCGRCVPRFHWDRWICDGRFGCGKLVPLPAKIPDLSTLVGEKLKVFSQPKHPFWILGDIDAEPSGEFILSGIRFREYSHEMPGGGKVTFLRSKPPRTTTPGSIFDDLFQSITWGANMAGEISLVRHPVQSRVAGSRINRFEALFGPKEDKTGTTPVASFDTAPVAVGAALRFLTEILAYLAGSEEDGDSETPSKVAVTAYAGGEQKEGFKPATHNGESQTSVALCLGSPVRVRWRYNSNFWNHNGGVPPNGDPLQDTKHFDAVQDLKQQGLSTREYEKRKRETLSRPPRDKHAPTYLSTDLGHGDILITRGEAIADHFETAIEPHGSLHLRLTMFTSEAVPPPTKPASDGKSGPSTAVKKPKKPLTPHKKINIPKPSKEKGKEPEVPYEVPTGPPTSTTAQPAEPIESVLVGADPATTSSPTPTTTTATTGKGKRKVAWADENFLPSDAEPEEQVKVEAEVEVEAEAEVEVEDEDTGPTSQRNDGRWCTVMVARADGEIDNNNNDNNDTARDRGRKKRGVEEVKEEAAAGQDEQGRGWTGVRRKKRVVYGRVRW